MDLTPYLEAVRADLEAVAGSDEATLAVADRLARALEASLQLRMLDALGQAAQELGEQLPSGRVDVRLSGRDVAPGRGGRRARPPSPRTPRTTAARRGSRSGCRRASRPGWSSKRPARASRRTPGSIRAVARGLGPATAAAPASAPVWATGSRAWPRASPADTTRPKEGTRRWTRHSRRPAGCTWRCASPPARSASRPRRPRRPRSPISGERDPDDIRIVFDDARADEQRLTIEHKERGKRFGWRGNELRVDMTVPLGTLVSCDTGSADLEVTGRHRVAGLPQRLGRRPVRRRRRRRQREGGERRPGRRQRRRPVLVHLRVG